MRGGLLTIGCSVVAYATSVGAQGAPVRRELLTRADAASRAGQHAEALALGEAAGRMQMTPSVRMFLAEEHEALAAGEAPGRHLLDAVDAAAACVREANAQHALNNRDWILARCTTLLQRLNARIARVRVVVAAGAGASVRLDGRALTAAEWNTPLEVLPGARVVEATGAGGAVFRQTVQLEAGGSATVTVVFAEAAGGGERGGERGGGERGGGERGGGAPAPVWPRVLGWSLVGAGAVGLAVSAWQWASSSGYADDSLNGTGELGGAWARYANRIAPPDALGVRAIAIANACVQARADAATGDADARGAASLCDEHAQAQALAVAFGVGGAALAVAGVVLVAVAPRARAARVAVAPVVGAGLGGVVVGGAF